MGPSSPSSRFRTESTTGVLAWMVASVLDSRILTLSSGNSSPKTMANLAPDCSAFWNCLLIFRGAMVVSALIPALRRSERTLMASRRLVSSAMTR